MILFRQLFDDDTSTLTYILADPVTRDAIIIDPVHEQFDRDLAEICDMEVRLKYILETHVHADHITGGGRLREETGARFVAGVGSRLECADLLLADGDSLSFGNEVIHALATPGHTDGCTTYRWRDRLFTGDTLLIDACGRTDFQQGSAERLYNSLSRLFEFPAETLVFPGHDYNGRRVSTLSQEAGINPYWAGLTKAEFIEKLNALNLPKPRKIDVAVPANLRCGEAA
ncbi:MAG: MBL fold metallo-hydrolase [Halothiobacillaceae bacterium]|jgi:glyoxylase-like metal-dependent hydrolase (beta-lactamase superfamily II)|nr:MBL fold metallo-hydrolase [Halothiobacillaceae bacterium]